MAKIDRFDGNFKAFAADSDTNKRTVFGAETASNAITANMTADFFAGWEIIGAGGVPPMQWFNAMGFLPTQVLAYLHQMGIAEYHASQEYPQHGICNRNGVLYRSLVNANIGNTPESSPTEWEVAVPAGASEAEAQAGVVNDKFSTPLRVADYVDFIKATTDQSNGTSNDYLLTPATITPKFEISRTHVCPDRQTALSGPVDGSYLAAFLVGVGDDEIHLVSGVDTTPLVVTFADGFDGFGERNLVVSIDDDEAVTWTLTDDSQTNYVYLSASTFATTATITAGSTLLAPAYTATPPTGPSTGQYWFSTVLYKGFTWDGAAWQPALRVFLGQGQSSGSDVTNVISYAYRGRYSMESSTVSLEAAEDWQITVTHNIGVSAESVALDSNRYRVATVVAGDAVVGSIYTIVTSNLSTGSNPLSAISYTHGRRVSAVTRRAQNNDVTYIAASTSALSRTTGSFIIEARRTF